VAWVASIAAAVAIHLLAGAGSARDFIAVYVIERSLSLDNLFLFLSRRRWQKHGRHRDAPRSSRCR
jgi:predicted tellurium resistance membrane protein TerC